MYTYDLALPGKHGIRITHAEEPLFKYVRSWMLAGAYLPGVSFDGKQRTGFKLTMRAEEHPVLLQTPASNRNVMLFDTWKDDASLLDILNLAYGAARVMWLGQAMYPVHCACIGDDSGYILLVGHTGVGKTSVAMNAARKLAKKVYSGNKTLVSISPEGYMRAIAGTRTMTCRSEDAKSLVGIRTEYLGRTATVLDADAYAPTATVDIKAIVLPRLNDGVQNRSTLEPVSALHTLFPFFLDMVNANVVLAGRGTFVGTPPHGSEERLAEKLAAATARIPVYSVTGSMDFVTEALASI